MKLYKQLSKVKHGAPTNEVALTKSGEIIVGKFVDRERPEFSDMMNKHLRERIGRPIHRGGTGMQQLQQLTEIRVAGFGGQGVIMAASVIGKATSIVDGDFATMTQNFGPEARGGACSAQLFCPRLRCCIPTSLSRTSWW